MLAGLDIQSVVCMRERRCIASVLLLARVYHDIVRWVWCGGDCDLMPMTSILAWDSEQSGKIGRYLIEILLQALAKLSSG